MGYISYLYFSLFLTYESNINFFYINHIYINSFS